MSSLMLCFKVNLFSSPTRSSLKPSTSKGRIFLKTFNNFNGAVSFRCFRLVELTISLKDISSDPDKSKDDFLKFFTKFKVILAKSSLFIGWNLFSPFPIEG